jgi:hypothetical protein
MTISVEDIPIDVIISAAGRPDVISAMKKFYADLDIHIAAQKTTCGCCGKCCDFGKFDHRLYVTTLEAAYYLAGGSSPQILESDVCPHLSGGKCLARECRTVACRIFYCDPESGQWQGSLTEEFHTRLRILHDQVRVDYFYADWLVVLKALSLTRG